LAIQRGGRPEAAAEIWNWREPQIGAEAQESPQRARVLGSLQAVGTALLGALLFNYWSSIVGTVVLGLAGVILASALISPTGLYLGIRRGFSALGQLTGRAMTWILMVPIFYLIFLPFGALFRRGRRDRLKRYFDTDAATYWDPHEGPTASSHRYDRQF
jgi:hypothetical protein